MMIDRERQEAIDAGQRALDSLYGARQNWTVPEIGACWIFSAADC